MTAPFIEIGEGHRLYVRDWGEGVPIVLLAGWAMDTRVWGETMMRLNASGFRTIAYDRRGHGRSTDPGRFDYDKLADDLAAVIDALGLDRVSLVGHSGASGEIIRYLTRHGSSGVRNVILAGATGPLMIARERGAPGIPPEMVGRALQRFVEDLPGWTAENIRSFAPGADEATLHWLSQMPRDASRRALVDFQRSILATDFTVEAGAIDVPVTLIHGDRDTSAPIDWTARRYADLIPKAELRIYRDGAHGLMITHAARLSADIANSCRT